MFDSTLIRSFDGIFMGMWFDAIIITVLYQFCGIFVIKIHISLWGKYGGSDNDDDRIKDMQKQGWVSANDDFSLFLNHEYIITKFGLLWNILRLVKLRWYLEVEGNITTIRKFVQNFWNTSVNSTNLTKCSFLLQSHNNVNYVSYSTRITCNSY